MEIEKQFFTSRLKLEDRKILEETENKVSILELLEAWLARMPFSKFEGFDFWGAYSSAVNKMLDQDFEIITTNPSLNEEVRGMELKNLEMTRETFATLLDADRFEAWKKDGKVRLSQKRHALCCLHFSLSRLSRSSNAF